MSWTSIHNFSGTVSDLTPWTYLSLLLYNHKGFNLGHPWMAQWFSYFLQFKSEFCNKEFMIWAIVSSHACFCWLYRASSSLAAKNIINLILVLTTWWCPWVSCLLCCWKRVFAMTNAFSWKTLLAFALLHFALKAKLTCYSRYLLTSYFGIPVSYNEKDIFFLC